MHSFDSTCYARILVVLVLAQQLVGCKTDDNTSKKDSDLHIVSERLYDFELVNKRSPASLDNNMLIDASYMRFYDNNLYIVDTGDFKIKRFTENGELINTIIDGVGSGPGEVSAPVDIYVSGDTVWVLDPNPRKLLKFSRDGNFVDQLTLPNLALKMIRLNNDIVLQTPMGRDFFKVVDGSGNILRGFGTEITNLAENRLALTGSIIPLEASFLFVPRIGNYFYRYSVDGKLLETHPKINPIELPESMNDVEQGGRMMRSVSANVETRSASVFGEEVVFHNWYEDKTEIGYQVVLDRYRLLDGEYIGSIGLPVSSSRVVLNGDKLYCIDDSLIVFDLQRL